MTEENTDVELKTQDLTVSVTFVDGVAKKTVLEITAAVSPEDLAKIKEDPTGDLHIKYIIGHVLYRFGLNKKVETV